MGARVQAKSYNEAEAILKECYKTSYEGDIKITFLRFDKARNYWFMLAERLLC